MNRQLKYKIANMIGCNYNLNRRILCIKRSWDEVEAMLCCRDACHRPRKEKHGKHKHGKGHSGCGCK